MATTNLNPQLQIRTYNGFAMIPYLRQKRAITLQKITFLKFYCFRTFSGSKTYFVPKGIPIGFQMAEKNADRHTFSYLYNQRCWLYVLCYTSSVAVVINKRVFDTLRLCGIKPLTSPDRDPSHRKFRPFKNIGDQSTTRIMSGLALNWVRLASNVTNLGLFDIEFQFILTRRLWMLCKCKPQASASLNSTSRLSPIF